MPQLDPTWFASQLFWLFVCFVTLYVVLSRVILPPILGIVGQRTQTIANNVAKAEAFRIEAERAQQDYEQALAQSRDMSQTLIAEVLAENKKHAEVAEKKLAGEIVVKMTEGRSRINGRKHEIIASLTPAAAEFAGMIAEKIVAQPVNQDLASRAVMDLIKAKG